MAMIASLRHRPTRAPPSPSTSSSATTASFKAAAAAKVVAANAVDTSPANPAATKPQKNTATKNSSNSSTFTSTIEDENNESSVLGDNDEGGAFIELDCHHLLQDMQDTLGDSLLMTNKTVTETWRSTKATAGEKIREVEHQMTETWDASKAAAFEGARRLLRFEELPKEWQSNPYILTGYSVCFL